MKASVLLFIAMFLATVCAASAGELPDRRLTPGEANPVLTAKVLCAPGFSTKTYRSVSVAVKRQAYANYGMQANKGACAGKGCEIDHLVSLEIGGSNSIKNLWPQPYAGPWNAHIKDRLENRLHRLVCGGMLDLRKAQEDIATDWVAVYKRQFGAH